jgi:hypothetical protein
MMSQLTIDSVQRDFKAWRSSRTKRAKIPDDLWNKTLKLLEHYPISQVVRDLGLNGGQVSAKRKQQREANSNIASVKTPVNFLELNMSPTATPYDTHVSGNRLEIKRADGAALTIEQFTEQTLLQVLNQFMRGMPSCYN